MTKRECPREILEALAMAVAEADDCAPGKLPLLIREKLAKVRSATAPLRTRAEVDAEIAKEVRCIPFPDLSGGGHYLEINGIVVEKLRALCREPTTSGPGGVEKECDGCQDSSHPQLYPVRVPEQTRMLCAQCMKTWGGR